MKPGMIVEWEEKITETGITLEGSATVKRRGEVVSSHVFPMQTQNGIAHMACFIVRRVDTNKFIVVDSFNCSCISEPVTQFSEMGVDVSEILRK